MQEAKVAQFDTQRTRTDAESHKHDMRKLFETAKKDAEADANSRRSLVRSLGSCSMAYLKMQITEAQEESVSVLASLIDPMRVNPNG